MNPRPYQADCIAKVMDGFATHQKQLIVIPTGGGKTNVFAWIAEKFLPGRVLFLAHRQELIEQAVQKIRSTTGLYAHTEKAEQRASRHAQMVVGSVQTMQGARLQRWPQNHFDLIVCDEAHHSIADGWQKTIRHFPTAKVLGVTATPERSDERNLGEFFTNIPFQVGLFDLVAQGYLSKIVIKSVPLKIEVGSVGISKGDYDVTQLAHALDSYLPRIAAAIRDHAGFRRVLIFLPLIATSQKMAQCMKDAGFKCEHVDGESENRKQILARFESGETEALCNAMLLTEGYDCPPVDCVVNLRLTKSEALYRQIVGRGTRIHPTKENLLLLDFLWAHTKHQLCRPATLISSEPQDVEEITEAAEFKSEYGEQELDLQGLMSEVQEQREKKLAKELQRKAKEQARTVDAMNLAMQVAPLEQRGIGAEMASFKQLQLIIKTRLHPEPHKLTRLEANDILGEFFNRKRKAA